METVATRRAAQDPPGFVLGGEKTLAALRIATGVGALYVFRGLLPFQIPPESLWFPPPGTAWLNFLPVAQIGYDTGIAIGLIASVGVTLGWRPRLTASLAALTLFYVGWVTTLTGKVDHFHHVLWVLVILAVSPCANVWAIRRETRSGSYRWPVTAVITLIGLIYLGAGLQKLLSAGLAWGWSDNLANTMVAQAWEKGFPAREWLLEWPLVGRLMGLGGLAFELAFLPVLLYPKTRWLWPLGPIFHLSVWITLGISFWTLTIMYVVFLPWGDEATTDQPVTDLQRRLIVSLVAAVTVFSVAGIERAWPVAAYPGFAGIHGPAVTYVEADGRPLSELALVQAVRPQRITTMVRGAVRNDRVDEFRTWLGVSELTFVTVDATTGVETERTAVAGHRS